MFDAISLPNLTKVTGGCNMDAQPQPGARAAARPGQPPAQGDQGDDPNAAAAAGANPGGQPGAQPAGGGQIDACQLGQQILALITNLIQQLAQRRQA